MGTVGGLVAALLLLGLFLLFNPSAKVHDTEMASPGGAHTATLHEVNTGAAGSYSQALLRATGAGRDTVLVDGGWQFVTALTWTGPQSLRVTTGRDGPPDPSWPKSCQGVQIAYDTQK